MATHQAPLSLGFSMQEHRNGLPFSSPMHESEKWKWSRSVVSDSSRPHGLKPTRLLSPRDSQGKSTGVGRHRLTSWQMGKAVSQTEGAAHGKALWSQGTYRVQLRAVKSGWRDSGILWQRQRAGLSTWSPAEDSDCELWAAGSYQNILGQLRVSELRDSLRPWEEQSVARKVSMCLYLFRFSYRFILIHPVKNFPAFNYLM